MFNSRDHLLSKVYRKSPPSKKEINNKFAKRAGRLACSLSMILNGAEISADNLSS